AESKADAQAKHLELAKSESSVGVVTADGSYVYLENDLLKLKIAASSGAIVEARLKEYGVENIPGSLGVRVFGSDENGFFKYYFKSGFTSESTNYKLLSYGQGSVTLYDEGLGVKKEISFLPDTYEIQVKDTAENGSAGKAFASLYRTEGRSLDLKTEITQGGMMNNSSYQAVAFSTSDDPYETQRLRGLDEKMSFLSRGGWVSFIQKYFFAAVIGSSDFVYNYFAQPGDAGIYSMGYTVEKGDAQNLVYSHSHRVFIGPKIRKDLEKRAPNLELSIDMGWFWFISQPMVRALDWINDYVGNWGLSIVVFTLLLKLLLFPVTAKGFVSMANMRKVMPKLNELKDRYGNDKQKMAQEQMALFKKEGANPLGGCLPMIAQMPFFIGFFFALREMVELRYADFGLWVTDLSVPDPLFVLPVVFGFIMVLTQKLNPQPANMDPTQAQIMKFMPIMFSVMFVIFPAALALYSVVNAGVSLIQQRYLYSKLGVLGDPSGKA
ncbi:membrane protein insertase YidC, partial [Gammaproteobacteria bacterium]|nr:membrane protein insertase YidC [Gammaproteobacteria bacterium]